MRPPYTSSEKNIKKQGELTRQYKYLIQVIFYELTVNESFLMCLWVVGVWGRIIGEITDKKRRPRE